MFNLNMEYFRIMIAFILESSKEFIYSPPILYTITHKKKIKVKKGQTFNVIYTVKTIEFISEKVEAKIASSMRLILSNLLRIMFIF